MGIPQMPDEMKKGRNWKNRNGINKFDGWKPEREMVRSMIPDGEFFEIFIDTPIEEAERRDVKGLYKKARAGEITNFTGISSPYEAPENPEIRIITSLMTPEQAAELIIERILGIWSPVL